MRKLVWIIFLIIFVGFLLYSIGLEKKIRDSEVVIKELEKKIKELEKEIKEIKSGMVEVWATAYTSSRKECDSTPFITASGKKVFWGVIAMDKRFKFGTKVYIPYFQKVFVVLDRGSAIKGNRIDIWMSNRNDALKFGRKKLIVYVLWR